MSKLRELARGRPCMIRIPGVCNGNTETTVLAHIRMAGITGAGQKAPDQLGAWACSSCHDAVDGRCSRDLKKEYRIANLERDSFNTPSKPKDNSVDLVALELAKNNRHKGWARRWLKEHGHWF